MDHARGQPEACYVTGFTIEAVGDGLSFAQTAPDPAAWSVNILSVTPGDYDIAVYVTYGERKSPPDFDYQTNCSFALTVLANVPYGVTGLWISGGPTSCRSGGVRVEFKKTSDSSWSSYTIPNKNGSIENINKRFIIGDLDHGVSYDFRVAGIGANGGVTATSAIVTATAGDGARGTTSMEGAPRNVRVEPNIFLGLSVWWDAPSSTPTGTTVNGYYVEYKAMDATTWTRAATGTTDNRLASTARSLHNSDSNTTLRGIGKLDEGKTYRVRVVTELADGPLRLFRPKTHPAHRSGQ